MEMLPDLPLSPPEGKYDELITDIVGACEEETELLSNIKFEYEDIRIVIHDCRHLSYDLKEQINEHYETEIENLEDDIRNLTNRLEELRAF